MNIFNHICSLFFAHRCPLCNQELLSSKAWLCNSCMMDLPLTMTWDIDQNPLEQQFWGLLPLKGACSLIIYSKSSPYTKLIYNFKYHNYWKIAYQMGMYFGNILKHSEKYSDVDYILPVPLHPLRRLHRGYNQSEYIARGMAKTMGCMVDFHSLKRVVHNPTQTHKDKYERWDNVKNVFKVKDLAHLKGKHILIVDDVLTTGATVVSLIEQILSKQSDCTISVAALASKAKLPGLGAVDDKE